MNKAIGAIIGAITTYDGSEHHYLRGYQIKVVAVFKGAARPDHDPDDGDHREREINPERLKRPISTHG